MEAGIVKAMHSTSGGEMMHIIVKLPATVTTLVRIWITSVDRQVLTTSTS